MSVLIHAPQVLLIRKQGQEEWWGEVNPADLKEDEPEWKAGLHFCRNNVSTPTAFPTHTSQDE